ncbi:MAG: RsiV family protein [Candidatus Eremiobacteraeota bacterium]|nr:RsiV family protein [Candidatus Eremiobacteraeota bacterium]
MKHVMTAVLLLLFFFQALPARCKEAGTFRWTIKTLEKKEKDCAFTFSYPELSTDCAIMGVQGIVKDFNRRMLRTAEGERDSFFKEMKNDKTSSGPPEVPNERSVACTQVGSTPRYASFVFDHYEMCRDMAHPENWYTTVNWSADGKYLVLDDILKPGAKTLEVLSSESERLLRAKFKEDGELLNAAGWAPKADNFKHFCMGGDGLHVFFLFYQIGPRPLGGPEITIPWKPLESSLTPRGKALLGK